MPRSGPVCSLGLRSVGMRAKVVQGPFLALRRAVDHQDVATRVAHQREGDAQARLAGAHDQHVERGPAAVQARHHPVRVRMGGHHDVPRDLGFERLQAFVLLHHRRAAIPVPAQGLGMHVASRITPRCIENWGAYGQGRQDERGPHRARPVAPQADGVGRRRRSGDRGLPAQDGLRAEEDRGEVYAGLAARGRQHLVLRRQAVLGARPASTSSSRRAPVPPPPPRRSHRASTSSASPPRPTRSSRRSRACRCCRWAASTTTPPWASPCGPNLRSRRQPSSRARRSARR